MACASPPCSRAANALAVNSSQNLLCWLRCSRMVSLALCSQPRHKFAGFTGDNGFASTAAAFLRCGVVRNDALPDHQRYKVSIRQFASFRLNIARNGNIHQQHWLVATAFNARSTHAFPDVGNGLAVELMMISASRRRSSISLRQSLPAPTSSAAQNLGTFASAVGDNHLLYFVFAQMTRHQLDSFARAYQQHCDHESDSKICRALSLKPQSDRHSAGTDICFPVRTRFRDRKISGTYVPVRAILHMTFLRIGKRF